MEGFSYLTGGENYHGICKSINFSWKVLFVLEKNDNMEKYSYLTNDWLITSFEDGWDVHLLRPLKRLYFCLAILPAGSQTGRQLWTRPWSFCSSSTWTWRSSWAGWQRPRPPAMCWLMPPTRSSRLGGICWHSGRLVQERKRCKSSLHSVPE